MGDLFTLENVFTLLMLILLQAVLGFDNLLYISLESKRAPKEKRRYIQKMGIAMAIVLRIGLLFALVNLAKAFGEPMGDYTLGTWFEIKPSIHSLIVIAGGVFIIYTAMKEIWHMMSLKEHEKSESKARSVGMSITMIVIMNVVFSFDSILSAMALTDNLIIMTVAIVIGGILMIWLADRISRFLERNRMYEVLGLFILFLVGVMLLSEGGHMSELAFFGEHVTEMSKATFYFILVVLVIVDVVQARYQKKLIATEEKLKAEAAETTEKTN